MVEPTRTLVLPIRIAASKSPDMPIDSPRLAASSPSSSATCCQERPSCVSPSVRARRRAAATCLVAAAPQAVEVLRPGGVVGHADGHEPHQAQAGAALPHVARQRPRLLARRHAALRLLAARVHLPRWWHAQRQTRARAAARGGASAGVPAA
eukprot:scaffold1100_cov323-Prasinococcus_capsulatus_cf.AAC.2